MADPDAVVQNIFEIVVGLVILIAVYKAFFGSGLSNFSLMVSDLAVPFVIGLVVLYFGLWFVKSI
ncbi:hypothetical protein [Haladaptatus cibarius]|uniref:hypothetical protein n=1 Tax=Haladaptatus cibarius TaxID=453847 RepID=UPI000678AEA8|nr:hypothetical protein [Haladaptatus cibarius]